MLKATGDIETGLRGLIRGAIAAAHHVPHLARLALSVLDGLHPPPLPVAPPTEDPQLALWVVDAEGVPPRPWRLPVDAVIRCHRLGGCTIPAVQCVARQVASQVQQTQQSSRGKASDFPLCTTEGCAQGRGVRAALDPAANVEPDENAKKGGYHRVRLRSPAARRAQRKAAMKQDRVGLLDEVHILDVHADPEPDVDEDQGAVVPSKGGEPNDDGDASEGTNA